MWALMWACVHSDLFSLATIDRCGLCWDAVCVQTFGAMEGQPFHESLTVNGKAFNRIRILQVPCCPKTLSLPTSPLCVFEVRVVVDAACCRTARCSKRRACR